MLLDSDAKLTKPQCLLITGAVRNGICPGPMGIHTHSCCGKETTTEATMSLASWAQVRPLPLGNRDLQSRPTCWQSTESSWGIPQTSFLEPASWRTTGSDWVSELRLLSNSNGRVRIPCSWADSKGYKYVLFCSKNNDPFCFLLLRVWMRAQSLSRVHSLRLHWL